MAKRTKVTLPDTLDARIEEIREQRAVGGAKPPRTAIIVAAAELGLPFLCSDRPPPRPAAP